MATVYSYIFPLLYLHLTNILIIIILILNDQTNINHFDNNNKIVNLFFKKLSIIRITCLIVKECTEMTDSFNCILKKFFAPSVCLHISPAIYPMSILVAQITISNSNLKMNFDDKR